MRLTGLIAVAVAAVVPATADRLFSPGELQSDLATLRALLEYNHPALHAWVDRSTLDSYFESAFGAATREMDAVEFLTLVQPLVARVGCGHTRAYAAGRVGRRHRAQVPAAHVCCSHGASAASGRPMSWTRSLRPAARSSR